MVLKEIWNKKDDLVEVVSGEAGADDSTKVGAALLLTQTIIGAERGKVLFKFSRPFSVHTTRT